MNILSTEAKQAIVEKVLARVASVAWVKRSGTRETLLTKTTSLINPVGSPIFR